MPDKKLDDLFKEKFMDAQIAPSADLWANISAKIEPKRKRKLPILWLAAACLAVVFAVKLLSPGAEKIYLQGSTPLTTQAVVAIESQVDHHSSTAVVYNTDETSKQVAIKTNFVSAKSAKNEAPIKKAENNYIAMQPIDEQQHLPIKRAEVKPLTIVPEEISKPEEPVTYIASHHQDANVDEDANVDSEHKKGIRNMGDLINYVVEKVDKRDQKLIKFNTDDDDNSSIIGLNIGFLKLNKKNR